MADIEFKCPHCGQELNGGDELAGQSVECPACGKSFTVPGFGAMPAAPAAAPAMGSAGGAGDNDKTVKIELPPEFLEEPAKHVFKIKRFQR